MLKLNSRTFTFNIFTYLALNLIHCRKQAVNALEIVSVLSEVLKAVLSGAGPEVHSFILYNLE